MEVKEEEEKPQIEDKGHSKGHSKGPPVADVTFTCHRCGLTESCHYFGLEPPFCGDQVKFSEDTFVLRDPFTPEYVDFKGKRRCGFLILGGKCFVKVQSCQI